MINTKQAEIVIRDNEIIVKNKITGQNLGYLTREKLQQLLAPVPAVPVPAGGVVVKKVEKITTSVNLEGYTSPVLPNGCKLLASNKDRVVCLIEKEPFTLELHKTKVSLPYTQYIMWFLNVNNTHLKCKCILWLCSKNPCKPSDIVTPCILDNVRGDGSVCIGYDSPTKKQFPYNQLKECCNYYLQFVLSNNFTGNIANGNSIVTDRSKSTEITADQVIKFSQDSLQSWLKYESKFDISKFTYQELVTKLLNNKYSPHWIIR